MATIDLTNDADTRERVLEAAGQVFAEKGFEAATVREICRRGKANLAAINYHFGDKRRLYVESVRRAHLRRFEEIPLPQWPDGTPADKKLADFVLTFLRRIIGPREREWEGELMMREIGRPTEACQAVVEDSIRPDFLILNEILAEIAPEMTNEKRRLVAFSVVGQCLHYKVTEPIIRLLLSAEEYESLKPELLAEHITDFTLRGIGARK
jgi:AcrR family transcriptional regulator